MNIGIHVSFQIMVFWGSYLYILLICYYLKGHLWLGLLCWTGQAQNISSLSLYSPHVWLIVFQPPCEVQCAGVTWRHHQLPKPNFRAGLPLWFIWSRIRLPCRRPGFNPRSGRSPGEGNGNPLQYSQRVGHDWATSLIASDYYCISHSCWDIFISYFMSACSL